MAIKQKVGNLITEAVKGYVDVIVHGCNCFHTMGGGIAYQIKKAFPKAYEADLTTVKGDRNKLGTISSCNMDIIGDKDYQIISHNITVINAYTQCTFWDTADMLDYSAVKSCFQHIANTYPDKRIGMPQIGCGLAGGDWDIVYKLIQETLYDCDVTIYTLE